MKESMKTNYESSRTPEAKETIVRIARYASKNMMRTKVKSSVYARIVDACIEDLRKNGIEND